MKYLAYVHLILPVQVNCAW